MPALAATLRESITPGVTGFAARKAPSPLERSILRAVTYAGLFDYPLLPAEVCRTLTGERATEAGVMACVRDSAYLGARLRYYRGYLLPVGREALVDERLARQSRSLALIRAHRRVLDLVAAMPFVRLAAVSGSLAHLNAGRGADVDLFLVTAPGRVWTVTLSLVVAAKLLGRRRSLCVNYVIDQTALALPHHDEFAANQVLHLRPITGAPVYRDLVAANPFVTATYPNFDPGETSAWPFRPSAWTAPVQRALETVLAWPARVVEPVARAVYGAYLRRQVRRWPSPEGVELSASVLKLHGHSHRRAITRAFAAALAEVEAEARLRTRGGAWRGSN